MAMHKLYIFILVFGSVLASILTADHSNAISSNAVISQIQLGNAASASNEIVEVYNNSSSAVEVTNWCLYYASASSVLNGSKLTCFLVENDNIHLFLPGRSFALAISNQLSVAVPTMGSDLKFSATLSGTAGHIRLIDNNGLEIDKVGWGATAVSAEGLKPVETALNGKVIGRKTAGASVLQDTDINVDDFETVDPRVIYNYGSVYEVQDLCVNINGIQTIIPDGYSIDTVGNCNPPPVDVCSNLDGLQIVVPDGYFIDENNNCMSDICPNIGGIQTGIPDGYKIETSNTGNSCLLDLLPLKITELLPNPIGSDVGGEFIEIFNPNANDVSLSNYVLNVGSSVSNYVFPTGSIIGVGKYISFSNDDIKFTLVNTTGKIDLMSADGQVIDETPAYINPNDGMAWALINEVWQYTDQPTPGGANIASTVKLISDPMSVSRLEPCAANQYRSLETNRCRLISTSNSTLAPCKDGQYRNEETNRCRSIASNVTALAPCKTGQERNPDTNRCRSVAAVLGASNLAPCKAGQERNPDTNRCRNVAGAMLKADYAPEQTSQSSGNSIMWWSLAAVGSVAIVYGLWEWRQEITGLAKKIKSVVAGKKV